MAESAKARTAEMRGRSDDELKDRLTSLKKEQFNLRFQQATGQLEGTARFKVIRRDIARIKTLLGDRARTAQAG